MIKRKPLYRRLVAVLAVAVLVAIAAMRSAGADVIYMPDVTEEMSDPAFWSNKVGNPHTVLASQEQVDAMNAAILAESATCMNDLASWEEGTFDGAAYAQMLKQAALADAEFFYDVYWGRYYWDEAQEKGVYLDRDTALYATEGTTLYGPMIENACDLDATTAEPYRFAICTTRTNVLSFPSNARILDAEHDPDFDYQFQSMLRVGEPVVISGESNDGNYYHISTTNSNGWVAASDVAICADKAEWLDAWQFAPDQTLVVYDDKIVTEESYYAPAASQKMLPMGTCLKLATSDEYDDGALLADINRGGYNCHVVWLPIREDDGSYSRQLALISEHCKVSEGFLPLTYENIAKVALNYLGDEYGWGGMLSADDCSGYVRDVYKCFGLELARNTTWQAAEPVRSYNFEGMSSAEKAEIIRTLPLGTVLFFGGHEMLYLGSEGDNLYVISSVSNASLDGESVSRLRGGIINTLNVRRGRSYNYQTWLEALTSANIPYLDSGTDPDIEEVAYLCKSGANAEWTKGQGLASGLTFVFDRNSDGTSTYDHFLGVSVDGTDLVRDQDYTALSGSVIIGLEPAYLESLDAGTHSLVAYFDDAKDASVSFTTLSATTLHAVQVSYSEGGFAGVSTASAEEGATVTVTVRPDDGWHLKELVATTAAGAGVELTKVDDTTYTLVMPADNVVVTASFEQNSAAEAHVRYRTHVQTYGTQDWKQDGATAGTTGESKRLEGLYVELVDAPCEGSIEYRTHVQSYGWQDYVANGAMSGTEGEAKRLEAMQIRLTGAMAEKYDVWYRVHAQTFGWMGWAKNDEPAGTAGYSKRLEALEVVVLPKDSAAPGDTANAFRFPISYKTHVQTYGWQDWAIDGAQSGTTGEGKRLEAIAINASGSPYEGSVQYRTHVQTYGWEDGWRADGAWSGTTGEGKRLEAIQICLTGALAEKYDVWYRVHAQTYGWLGWTCNGQSAGTEGQSKRLEAIQVQLVAKGGAAPGDTANPFVG